MMAAIRSWSGPRSGWMADRCAWCGRYVAKHEPWLERELVGGRIIRQLLCPECRAAAKVWKAVNVRVREIER